MTERAVPLTAVVARLLAAAGDPEGRPRIVGVDGTSASGKSTFAARVEAVVPRSAVVHTDDVAWHLDFFDWADELHRGVLAPLHRGEAVAHRPPAWDERGRQGAITVAAGLDLVLVEGVGIARRALVPLLDAVVWLGADPVRARERGIARDGGTAADVAFWEEWDARERPFLAAERPWERADLVVRGTPTVPHDPATEVVLDDGTR